MRVKPAVVCLAFITTILRRLAQFNKRNFICRWFKFHTLTTRTFRHAHTPIHTCTQTLIMSRCSMIFLKLQGKNRCRYIAGVVLNENATAEENEKTNEDLLSLFKLNGFKKVTFEPVGRCLHTTFPLRCGWLSILLAVHIVYPRFHKKFIEVSVDLTYLSLSPPFFIL